MYREIEHLHRGAFKFQYPVPGGIIDAVYLGDPATEGSLSPPIIVEIKLTQTADAYYQLGRYARHFQNPARVIITKTVVREIRTPEPPVYLRKIENLAHVEPGGYYVIPYQGKTAR